MTTDPHNLQRFIDAQSGVYETALAEIRRGAKREHWIWFIFPQITGLGRSEMAQHYAIGSMEEARAYLDHPLLGARYRESVTTLQDVTSGTAESIFGPVDAMKVRSSLTLFHEACDLILFRAALDRWFSGVGDEATLSILAGGKGPG